MRTKVESPSAETLENCATYLRALADPVRLQVMRSLQVGPLSVFDIADVLELEATRVSHHLRVLFHARLVTCKRDGKYIYYQINASLRHSTNSRLNVGCCQFDLPRQANDN